MSFQWPRRRPQYPPPPNNSTTTTIIRINSIRILRSSTAKPNLLAIATCRGTARALLRQALRLYRAVHFLEQARVLRIRAKPTDHGLAETISAASGCYQLRILTVTWRSPWTTTTPLEFSKVELWEHARLTALVSLYQPTEKPRPPETFSPTRFRRDTCRIQIRSLGQY